WPLPQSRRQGKERPPRQPPHSILSWALLGSRRGSITLRHATPVRAAQRTDTRIVYGDQPIAVRIADVAGNCTGAARREYGVDVAYVHLSVPVDIAPFYRGNFDGIFAGVKLRFAGG